MGDPHRRLESSLGTDGSSSARVLLRDPLGEAAKVGARSVAFPAVSAGVYGSQAADVARIAVAAVRGSPDLGELDPARFVLFNPATHEAFVTAMST
jgi:O-acetyl-ADP-ribose deacetylase (regulator of RNase III)